MASYRQLQGQIPTLSVGISPERNNEQGAREAPLLFTPT